MSEVRKLLDRLLSSRVKAELLLLFNKNPRLIDTRDGIARRIKLRGDVIELDLRDLSDIGLLDTEKFGNYEFFFLNHAKAREIQEVTAKYIREL